MEELGVSLTNRQFYPGGTLDSRTLLKGILLGSYAIRRQAMEASELPCKGTINVLGETCSLVCNYGSATSVCIYRPNRSRIHIPIGLHAIGTSDRRSYDQCLS